MKRKEKIKHVTVLAAPPPNEKKWQKEYDAADEKNILSFFLPKHLTPNVACLIFCTFPLGMPVFYQIF